MTVGAGEFVSFVEVCKISVSENRELTQSSRMHLVVVALNNRRHIGFRSAFPTVAQESSHRFHLVSPVLKPPVCVQDTRRSQPVVKLPDDFGNCFRFERCSWITDASSILRSVHALVLWRVPLLSRFIVQHHQER